MGDDLDELLGEDVGSDNENTWSERDKTLLGPCLGLLKASKSLLKKTKDTVKKNACCNSEQTVTQLDDLADLVDRLNPAVDELASSLYPPLHYQTLNENVSMIIKIICSLEIFISCHYYFLIFSMVYFNLYTQLICIKQIISDFSSPMHI